MKRITLLLLPLVWLVPVACPAQTKGRTQEISEKSVWELKDLDVWKKMHEKCEGGGGFDAWRSSAKKMGLREQRAKAKFVNCIAQRMKRAGAADPAIAFVREMGGEVYLDSFREMGKVDLAMTVAPMWNDPNVEDFVLVNGTPRVIQLWDKVDKIDITKDRMYPALARKFPEVTMWPMHNFESMKKLPNGGQRFIFSFVLLNGCRACDIAGSANVAFDFDAAGNFLKTHLVNLEKYVEEVRPANNAETVKTADAKEFTVPLGRTMNGFNFSRAGTLTYKRKPFSPAVAVNSSIIKAFKVSLLPARNLAGAIAVDDTVGQNSLFFLNITDMSATPMQEPGSWNAAQKIFWSPSQKYMVALCAYEGEWFTMIDVETRSVIDKRLAKPNTNAVIWFLDDGEPQWLENEDILTFNVREHCNYYEVTCSGDGVLARYKVNLDAATLRLAYVRQR